MGGKSCYKAILDFMQLCMRVHYQPNEQTTEMLEEEEDNQPEELEDKQLIR